MTNPDPDATSTAQAVLATVLDDWISRKGVVSIGVSRRWHDDVATNEVGIRVTVEQVLPQAEVPDGELFPGEVDGIPVDVVAGVGPTLE